MKKHQAVKRNIHGEGKKITKLATLVHASNDLNVLKYKPP